MANPEKALDYLAATKTAAGEWHATRYVEFYTDAMWTRSYVAPLPDGPWRAVTPWSRVSRATRSTANLPV